MQSKLSLLMTTTAILGCLAVVVGAFGAHGLKSVLSETALTTYQTGVAYHFYHVLALFAIVLWMKLQAPYSAWLMIASVCFIAGIVVFSGSLYVLAITGIRWLGMITPLGGLLFILGWLAIAIASVKGS